MSHGAVLDVLADVVAKLDALRADYAIGGSVASGVWGQPRYTNDVDINLALAAARSPAFLAALARDYLIGESELAEALAATTAFRMVQALHIAEAFKVDFFLVGDEPFGRSVLARARLVQLAPGLVCRVQTPEDVVLNKLRWFEEGRRVSERQWNDVVQVLEVQADTLDLDYLRHWANQLQIAELGEAALVEAGAI